jgi:hypothetical protein
MIGTAQGWRKRAARLSLHAVTMRRSVSGTVTNAGDGRRTTDRHRSSASTGAIVLLAVIASACGSGTSSAVSAPASSAPPSVLPVQLHRVGPGETMTKIAIAECGDRTAALAIFDANFGRRQADGGQLTDINLIEVGWELVIECELESPLPTVPPTNSTRNPGGPGSTSIAAVEGLTPRLRTGPLSRRNVPIITISLPPQAPTQPTTANGTGAACDPISRGVTPNRHIVATPIEAGQIETESIAEYGQQLFVSPRGFDSNVEVVLINDKGEFVPFRLSANFDPSLDLIPELPTGRYRVEVSDGRRLGVLPLQLVRAAGLRLIPDSSPASLVLLGARPTDRLDVMVEVPCPEPNGTLWSKVATLTNLSVDSSGNAHIKVLGRAPQLTYCVVTESLEDFLCPLGQSLR